MTDRTIYDLTDEEYERYENGEDGFDDVTENTIEDSLAMMGIDPDEDYSSTQSLGATPPGLKKTDMIMYIHNPKQMARLIELFGWRILKHIYL